MAIHKIDVGKDAKLNGSLHPRNVPLPADKATPKAVRHAKPDKPYGIRFERKFWRGKWESSRRWFKTEAHRDQAFEKERAHQATWVNGILAYRNLHKTER